MIRGGESQIPKIPNSGNVSTVDHEPFMVDCGVLRWASRSTVSSLKGLTLTSTVTDLRRRGLWKWHLHYEIHLVNFSRNEKSLKVASSNLFSKLREIDTLHLIRSSAADVLDLVLGLVLRLGNPLAPASVNPSFVLIGKSLDLHIALCIETRSCIKHPHQNFVFCKSFSPS